MAGGDAENEPPGGTRRRALSSLLETYWSPVYSFARLKGHAAEDARDLVQAFFTSLLENGALAGADSTRGRFRSYLLTSFANFANNQWHHENAQKRGGDCERFSLDQTEAESRFGGVAHRGLDPEGIYLQCWAQTLMETVLLQVAEEYVTKGQQAIFEALKPMLVGSPDAEGYGRIAEALDVSEGAVKVAAHRLRRRFGEILRQEIAHTLSDPEEVEDEIRGLFSALSGDHA
jgi:DNA-directed RNA polymerase specialized sigma24 family protein